MWELVTAALPCGGSPGFLDRLGMMVVWAVPFGMWVVLFCTVYNCRGALLHKKTPRVRSFFCLRLSILLQNASLFEFDGCADFFELVCHFLGFRFGNVFFNGRRRAVNKRFRFG